MITVKKTNNPEIILDKEAILEEDEYGYHYIGDGSNIKASHLQRSTSAPCFGTNFNNLEQNKASR